MDTILASIRRILNEDEVSPAETAVTPRDEAPPVEPDKDDVLVLGESMMVPSERPAAVPPPKAPAPVPEAASPAPEAPVPAPDAVSPAPDATNFSRSAEGLVAARTRAAAAQSFEALHEAMQRAQTPPPTVSSPALQRGGGLTLEDLVRDELRGLLSNWLDVHLPGLVEMLVRSEIEKLTRR